MKGSRATGLLLVGWVLAIIFSPPDRLYVGLGLYSLVAVPYLVYTQQQHLRRELADLRLWLWGAGAGAVAILGTHIAFMPMDTFWPDLHEAVRTEYSTRAMTGVYAVIPWLLPVATFEELFFRGHILPAKPRVLHLGGALALYLGCQAAIGSWVVVLLAFGLGSYWLALRTLTRSLWAPVLSHMLWTPAMMVIWPLF